MQLPWRTPPRAHGRRRPCRVGGQVERLEQRRGQRAGRRRRRTAARPPGGGRPRACRPRWWPPPACRRPSPRPAPGRTPPPCWAAPRPRPRGRRRPARRGRPAGAARRRRRGARARVEDQARVRPLAAHQRERLAQQRHALARLVRVGRADDRGLLGARAGVGVNASTSTGGGITWASTPSQRWNASRAAPLSATVALQRLVAATVTSRRLRRAISPAVVRDAHVGEDRRRPVARPSGRRPARRRCGSRARRRRRRAQRRYDSGAWVG